MKITIEIIKAIPPIMEIECADPMLCLIGEGGKVFINPSSRYDRRLNLIGVKLLSSITFFIAYFLKSFGLINFLINIKILFTFLQFLKWTNNENKEE